MNKNRKNGFTLVELLAVIAVLGLILIIAVPKITKTMDNSKRRTLELSVKSIARSAEEAYIENESFGITDEITCESVSSISSDEYELCEISFDSEGNASVTYVGKGSYDGFYVCNGTKMKAEATKGSCNGNSEGSDVVGGSENIEVEYPLLLKGQELTPDKFRVTVTDDNGNLRVLENGTKFAVDLNVEPTMITSPNWPAPYPAGMSESVNYWETTYEGYDAIQITFDETSKTESPEYVYITLYDKKGNKKYKLGGTSFGGKSYIIKGDYIKVTMSTPSNSVGDKGFSATIRPANIIPAEYTVSPSVVPLEGDFDITISVNDTNENKKISAKVQTYNLNNYIESHKEYDLVQTSIVHNETNYNAGIRYVGKIDEVKNKVYYNCDESDSNGVLYGANNYNYASSCEVWRIIGVFDVKSSVDGNAVSRIKLVNTNSTFKASFDSSADGTIEGQTSVNRGYGIDQWGESTYDNGTVYEGSDLMRLLNGYYVGNANASCVYCNAKNQEICNNTCTETSLKTAKMKVLTSIAKEMIENAVWDTYAVKEDYNRTPDSTWASIAYLQEKGISTQYFGKSSCEISSGVYCDDNVKRTMNWVGLVGLMSLADLTFADGWMYAGEYTSAWTITPAVSSYAAEMWNSSDSSAKTGSPSYNKLILPTVYLKSNIKVISGDGDTEPYILSVK